MFLADHHILFREGLTGLLSAEPGIEVVGGTAAAHEVAERVTALQPDILLLDPLMAGEMAIDMVRAVHSSSPATRIIILTVDLNDELLLGAIASGAKGYLLKDVPTHHLIQALRAVLRDEAALTRSMTRRIIDSLAQRTFGEASNGLDQLTDREKEVLEQICNGAANQEIASQLTISENTVKAHVRKILAKLNLNNRREAKQYALKQGFLNQFGSSGGKSSRPGSK